jgi:hypothetical protein
MRTKTLLLTAALAAAGIATSKAQVYSVNAVGYVNTTLVPGYQLVSNPLDNKNGNVIKDLFKNITPAIPNLLKVYKLVGTSFLTATYDDIIQDFQGNGINATLDPTKGEGAFVQVPGTATLTATFVGEVPQGNLSVALPSGFSIVSSPVPQAGNTADLKLDAIGQQGDSIYKYDTTTKKYVQARFDDIVGGFTLSNGNPVTIGVGEAFYYLNSKTAKTWTRTFSVNQ